MRTLKKIKKNKFYWKIGASLFIVAPFFSLLSCANSVHKNYMTWGHKSFVKQYDNLSYKDEADSVKLVNEIDYHTDTSNTIYQMLVYSFADGNNDGIGDFVGAKEKLSYLEGLGIDQILLSPTHPASSYHGYDVIDYTKVAPELGDMKAFDDFLREAHRRQIKVYLDMVFNHTSYEHPWFQEALKYPTSKYRNFYRFNDKKTYSSDLNKLDKDLVDKFSNILDKKVSEVEYVSKFWGGMPDLNLDNPAVINELKNVQKFWVKKGVDGFRYDAFVEYFSTQGETTKNYNHQKIFSELRKSGEEGARENSRNAKFKQFMLGEWWEDAIAPLKYFNYSKDNKALDSAYDNKNWRGKEIIMIDYKYIDKVTKAYRKSFAQWTPFLDNHDQERWITSYLQNIRNINGSNLNKSLDQHSVNAMKASLFEILTLPGNPIIFQGDELAYHGTRAVKDSYLREPIKWSSNKYKINFYDRRAGIEERIKIRNSANRPSAENQINNKNEPAYLVKKINGWRKQNPFIGFTDERTIDNPKTYINAKSELANILIRKSIDGKKKFLVVSSYESPYSFDLKTNFRIKDKTLLGDGIKIEGNNISLPKNSYAILEIM